MKEKCRILKDDKVIFEASGLKEALDYWQKLWAQAREWQKEKEVAKLFEKNCGIAPPIVGQKPSKGAPITSLMAIKDQIERQRRTK